MPMREAEVVVSLKRHLQREGIDGRRPDSILVDADPSFLRSTWRRELEPTAQVFVGGGRPDVLCSFRSDVGALVCGFEVKANMRDLHQGMAQASRYRAGVHRSWLALPGDPVRIERDGGEFARRNGVGLLALQDRSEWVEVLPASPPQPRPDEALTALRALDAVPLARQLQLNHPLNYLAVAVVAAQRLPDESLPDALGRMFGDLRTPESRRAAIAGAQTLHLIRRDHSLTLEGASVADLLTVLGFSLDRPATKRERLAEVDPAAAAVARMVLLQQATVRLVVQVLQEHPSGLNAVEMADAAIGRDPMLGSALFLSDPSSAADGERRGHDFNASTVFKFKQNLWHAGVLATKAHASAGKAAAKYRPLDDLWRLDRMP